MIDFQNLEPLPLRRQKDRNDRERLADASFKKKAAKHKGRNHFHAYQKRQREAIKAVERAARAEKTARTYAGYVEAVRAYWAGLRPDHPAKPF